MTDTESSPQAASTILVVDDDPTICEVMRLVLSHEGYHLAFASNGEQALAVAAERHPDVILLDVMLPGVDGFQVCRHLRSDSHLADVSILLITALTDRASRLKGLEAGADDFISKPLDRQELIARLRTITRLDRYHRLQEQAARLTQTKEDLEAEVAERLRAERALQELNASLERQVSARTAELETSIHKLESEIAERKRVENSLRQMEESLAQRVADQSRKLSALYEVILMAGQPGALNETLEQSLVKVVSVANGAAACIYRLDKEDGAILRLNAAHGLPATVENTIQTLPAGWLLDEGLTQTATDLAHASDVPPVLGQLGFGACVGVPIWLHDQVTGALIVFWVGPRTFAVEDLALFSAVADQVGVIVENARLRQIGEQAAVLHERQRLARELHDSVTQSLHSLVLTSDTAHALLEHGQHERLFTLLAHLAESARQALKEMRLLLYELRPLMLEEAGLIEALRFRLETVERRAGVDAQLVIQDDAHWLPDWRANRGEADLFRFILEALNNSLKHSRATRVTVSLCGNENGVELTIADNGCGFNPQLQRVGGMGLRSMAERARRLGGQFTIDSAIGRGTCIALFMETRGNSPSP